MSFAFIGSGDFGTALAINFAHNKCKEGALFYVRDITLTLNGRGEVLIDSNVLCKYDFINKESEMSLEKFINTYHYNPKHHPYIKIPESIIATHSLEKISHCQNIIWAVPHQYIQSYVSKFSKFTDGKGKKFLSCTKGLIPDEDVVFPSKVLDSMKADVAVLMGANIAIDIAQMAKSESVIVGSQDCVDLFEDIFSLKITKIIGDSNSKRVVELFGAFKNIVALSVGIVRGLRDSNKEVGSNTVAATFRIGIKELLQSIKFLLPEIEADTLHTILLSTAGIGDLFVTCISGRNYKMGVEIGKSGDKSRIGNVQGSGTLKALKNLLSEEDFNRLNLFKLLYGVLFLGEEGISLIKIF